MNKKSLLNLAMCSLLLGSMPMGLVGCKDYDGDIKDLNTTTGDLSSQISSLKTALDAANTAATNAANDAKAAADKADTATQEVALAKKAAEEAKAEAIAAAIAEVEKLQSQMSDMNAETAKELAALSGKIEGIETNLSNIDLSKVDEMLGGLSTQIQEANKQISAINVQIAALENLKTEVPAMKSSIEAITTELSTVKAKAEANTTSINEIKGELATISSKISSEVTNAVNTIAGILAQRLTSVTLIPELYVGGVPSISFENGIYNKIEWKADDKLAAGGYYTQALTTDNKLIKDTVTNGTVEAKYRLNPATITAQDIDLEGLGYFTHIAKFTRANEEKEVLTITGKSVGADGILTVQLSNPNPAELREGLKGDEDYTVSLRVPIAKSHLFEGETTAEVYSEFARLREINFTPSLGLSYQANDRGPLYVNNLSKRNGNGLYSTFAKSSIVKTLAYNKTYNLNDLFIGRMNNVTDTIASADLAKYDLALRYKVAAGSYVPNDVENGVDQQKYVKLSGEGNSILTPQTPTGVTANQAIIGKAPILLAELYDTNNGNIVDAAYFKVMFSAEEANDIEFTFNVNTFDIPGENDNFTADACGIQYTFTWEYMTQNMLEKLNGGKGMSQAEFRSIYTQSSWNTVSNVLSANCAVSNGANGNYELVDGNWYWSWSTSTSADVPMFIISANENNLPALKPGDNALVYANVLTFKAGIDGYPDIKVRVNWTPTLKVTKATLGETLTSSWTNNTMTIRVKPMNIVNGKWDGTTAEYSSNILAGRVKPYVNGLTGCATYSIAYASPEEQDAKLMESLHNYCGETFGKDGITKESQKTLEEVLYKLNSANANAKTLASKGGTIKLVWKSDINGLAKNLYTVGYTNLYVAPILQYKGGNVATLTSGSVPDTKTLAITFQDAYGNNVVENPKSGPDYWKFYGIEDITYTLDGAKWGTSTDVTTATKLSDTPYGVTLDETGTKITFNNNGSTVNTKSYIFVPFTVSHKWGELTGYALVTVNVTPN